MRSSFGIHGTARRGDVDAAMRYALGREQSGALGRAGKRLTDAIAAYRNVEAQGELPGEALQGRVADAVWCLLVQRECAGIRTGNMDWLRSAFDIPDAVVGRLGVAPWAARLG